MKVLPTNSLNPYYVYQKQQDIIKEESSEINDVVSFSALAQQYLLEMVSNNLTPLACNNAINALRENETMLRNRRYNKDNKYSQ